MMRVSVCMATRNKADVLDRVLSSIRTQSVPFDYEIIVADDGSTDHTVQVCAKHGARCVYLDNARYRNPARARNDAYRLARGEIIIAQSDDVIHHSPNTIRLLAENLRPASVLIATVLNMNADGSPCNNPFHVYSGPKQPRAFFFLGALWRSDLYAFGGNDEGFTEPCWDDNWFQDCILRGRKLSICYQEDVIGHHQSHSFPEGSHQNADVSKRYYYLRRRAAEKENRFVSPGGPWPETWPTIPKRMSFFWAGKKLSWLRYLTLASFRKWHPDWEMVLYRADAGDAATWRSSEREDCTDYDGPDYSDRLSTLNLRIVPWTCPVPNTSAAHACDLCQWEILSGDGGGFYSDMDIFWVQKLPEEVVCEADAVFCLSQGYMTIGFMGASPRSPLFATIGRRAEKSYDPRQYQSTGAGAIYDETGIGRTWTRDKEPGRVAVNALRDRFPSLRFRELPSITIYPFPYTDTARIFDSRTDLPAGTIGLHWFGASDASQQWNRLLTAENWRDHPNTLTPLIERVLT